MCNALVRQKADLGLTKCPIRKVPMVAWQQGLPSPLAALVVAPVNFDIAHEYEVVAERTTGYDHHNDPCYRAFRYLSTELHSDDDELFYQAPIYAETLTSWRLEDKRWLIFREFVGDFEFGPIHSHFAVCESMPR